jgi:hypothetical protein
VNLNFKKIKHKSSPSELEKNKNFRKKGKKRELILGKHDIIMVLSKNVKKKKSVESITTGFFCCLF